MSDHPQAAAHDFVDRLVMKAFGADLPVPRLPSLYESPAPLAAFRHGDADIEEVHSEIDAASPIRRARAPVSTAQVHATTRATPHASPVPSTPTPAAVSGQRATPAVAGTGLSRRAIADGAPADVRPAAPRAARGFAAEPVADDAGRGTPTRPPGSDAIGPGADTGRSLPVKHEALVAVPRSQTAARTSRRHHGMEDPTGAAAEPRDGVLVPRASGLAFPDVARPRGFDRPRRTDGPGEGTDVAVNVTIGRIEVRATPAAATDAKRTPSRGPQPLALDEYLGQRGAR